MSGEAGSAAPVLTVRGLTVTFVGRGPATPAVRGVDFEVRAGEVLGIVGESGSGKSVTALALTGLLGPGARVTGSVVLAGTDVLSADKETLRNMRGRDVGMVFQDPTTTLNPVLPIGRQITEGQVAHGALPPSLAAARRSFTITARSAPRYKHSRKTSHAPSGPIVNAVTVPP